MGFAGTVCFPVVAIVDEEVSDFAECFERDGVVERHGGGDDGEMMSGGNEGGGLFFVWNFLLCNGMGFVLVLVEYGSWFLFVFHFCSLFSCAR